MNKFLNKLHQIAQKDNKIIIGLMSGTSVDGLDIALCKVSGYGANTAVELLQFYTASYDADFKTEIASIFCKPMVDLEKLCLLNAWVGTQHANLILAALKKWNVSPTDVDLIASHGQTIYHAPKILHQQKKFSNATFQIGDGDHIAVKTGIITLSDFRQKHIAAGGEGAPLAVYGDYFLFSQKDEKRIMLNIGGIANFTFLDSGLDATKMFSTDVGPGNTMMDAYVQKHFPNKFYDEDAAIAKQGVINEALLEALLNNDFFKKGFPKTTGPELFNLKYLSQAQTASNTNNLSHQDVMATLNKFSATAIISAVTQTISETEFTIYSSGGGMHNPLLMQHLKAALPNTIFKTTNDLAINPDAKEAVLFAILANECISGNETSFGNGTPNVKMGKISLPN
jgi:anhydro-N-acetylmuramic acid kinase